MLARFVVSYNNLDEEVAAGNRARAEKGKIKNKPRSDAVTTTRLYNYYYLKAGVTREEREVEPAMYP